MSLIGYALKGSLGTFLNKLDDVSKKTNKSKFWLFNDFVSSFILTGAGYSDYLNYEFYKRSKQEKKEYVTIKDQDKFYEIVSPSKYKTYFTYKANFLNNFKEYINRDFFYLGTKEELNAFINKHEYFIYKPVDGLGGHDVKKVYTKDINLDDFFKEVSEKHILLEEFIIQHPDMSLFTDRSVNTIRVMSFGYNGHSEILAAMMRIGDGNHDVDNFHQGGMGVIVNTETGEVISDAVDKDNNTYEYHPISKVKFKGFKIPNWDKVKDMVLKAALKNEHIHVVGWDVAVTEDSCTFVEGNRRPGFDLPQVLANHGRKDMCRHCLEIINKAEGTNYKL